jgi:hypothetical protein
MAACVCEMSAYCKPLIATYLASALHDLLTNSDLVSKDDASAPATNVDGLNAQAENLNRFCEGH